jgi:hypothetical protein
MAPPAGQPALSCRPNRWDESNRERPSLTRPSASTLSFQIGSLRAWKVLRWKQDIRHCGAPRMAGCAHRGMAAQRPVAVPLLPDAPSHGHDVYTLTASDRRCGSPKICAQNARTLAETERDDHRNGRRFKLARGQMQARAQAFWEMHVQALERHDGQAVRRGGEALEVHPPEIWSTVARLQSTGAPCVTPVLAENRQRC